MKKYRLLSSGGSVSHKLYTLDEAIKELNTAIIAVVTPKNNKVVKVSL